MNDATAQSECDVAIIGGGVIGLSLAWELSRRGREVQLFERGAVGREASWAGAGMLPALPDQTKDAMEQFMAYSRRLHESWAVQLRETTGIDTGFQINGALHLARTIGERAALRAWQRDALDQGLACEWLDPDKLAAVEPALIAPTAPTQRGMQGAVRVPGEGQLRNPDHVRALCVAAKAAGAKIFEQHEAHELDVPTGRFTAGAVQVSSRQLVITAGPWSRSLLAGHWWSPDIFPVRGQMVLYGPGDCRSPRVTHTLNEGTRYLVPRKDGRLLAGSTEEEVGFDKRTTTEAIDELKEFAESLLPELQSAPIEKTWAGLRPAAFDEFPYVGAVPQHPHLFVATGHYRNGLNLSTGTAVALADVMMGQTPAIELERFQVGR